MIEILLIVTGLFLFYWFRDVNNRWRQEIPKKKRQRNSPQDVFLQSAIEDCLLYGEPKTVFVNKDFWKACNNQGTINHYLKTGMSINVSNSRFNTISVVFYNGNRKDYNF